METDKRTRSEYGGFLPLELNPGREYLSKYEPFVSRFNTVKAALVEILNQLDIKRIHIPYYYCPSTTEAIKETGIEVCFYHIDSNLEPVELPDNNGDIILLVNFFGVKGDYVKKKASEFKNVEIIIDTAHGFFFEPIIQEHIHNVYSAKKFFGVPDGAYLISKSLMHTSQTLTVSYQYSKYLLTSYEMGTNAVYKEKQEVDRLIANSYGCISKLSVGLLQNVDYNRVRIQRSSNYRYLYMSFWDTNELELPMDCPAYQFPLLISNEGKHIKNALIENSVFVPTLWTGDDLLQKGNSVEINMMNNAIFLPIDQRYNTDDMKYIVSLVKQIQEKKHG